MSTLTELPLDTQIKTLVEGRTPGDKQVEFAIFLIDEGVLANAAEAAAFIQAKRDYDRMQRENAAEPVKRVPVAQQIIQSLETLRERSVPNEVGPNEAYQAAVNDSISVAGRYVA